VFRLLMIPDGNDGLSVSVTVPENPSTGVIVTVELLLGPPARSVRNSGAVDMANVGPGTVTTRSAEW